MTNYSAPTHWECPKCGKEQQKTLWRSWCGCVARMVPCYRPIPPGERPEAEEPEEGAVCAFKGAGACEVCICTDAGRWSNFARGEWRHGKGRGIRVSRLRTRSEADAVLFVAEGVLP